MERNWTPSSWRKLERDQEINWPDRAKLERVEKELKTNFPLIYAGSCRKLQKHLADAVEGRAFVLQAGDCAETFEEFSADRVKNLFKVILQMAAVLTFAARVPVIKIGRVAGQFAKPRTQPTERRGKEELPSYFGDMVNRAYFSKNARTPNPENLITAYNQAANTLNLLQSFATGGFADLRAVHQWNLDFVKSSPEGKRYEAIAKGIDSALAFMKACGIDVPELHEVEFYSSHEALILEYEEALTRKDSTFNNKYYDCSAHLLWVGARTRDVNKAHIEFLSGIGNPIACKIDAKVTRDEILQLSKRLNPNNEPGRLTFISRMGAKNVKKHLPPLIGALRKAGSKVLWLCDPMHGNTFKTVNGIKTRSFDDIFSEIESYFNIHKEMGSWPGGLHLELTGENVTECIGGGDKLSEKELDVCYQSTCDPRLNARQGLDLVFSVAQLLEEFNR